MGREITLCYREETDRV